MNTALTRFRPLIPAGGVGSRLWPLSRAHAPKFLLDLTSSGNSLLRDTYDRLIDLSNGSVMVVTGTSHANAVTQQIPELRAADLVLEPPPRTRLQLSAWLALSSTAANRTPSSAPSQLTTSSAPWMSSTAW